MNNVLAGLMGVGVFLFLIVFAAGCYLVFDAFGPRGFALVVFCVCAGIFAHLGIETWGRK